MDRPSALRSPLSSGCRVLPPAGLRKASVGGTQAEAPLQIASGLRSKNNRGVYDLKEGSVRSRSLALLIGVIVLPLFNTSTFAGRCMAGESSSADVVLAQAIRERPQISPQALCRTCRSNCRQEGIVETNRCSTENIRNSNMRRFNRCMEESRSVQGLCLKQCYHMGC